MLTEADTCRVYVTKGLYAGGWSDDQIVEQYFFTDGRVLVMGGYERRGRRRFADYLLRYRRDVPLAVVEAKAAYKLPGDGLEQAKDYAATLGLPFAYATNGLGIVEFDRRTGLTTEIDAFPGPEELWQRFRADYHMESDEAVRPLLTPDYQAESKTPRYYQRIAISRAVEAIAKERPRILLTMATGTGKTTVAFQICWKLFEARWNRTGEHRRPRILYLADRTVLVDDPMAKDFAPFGDARSRIESANVSQGRSMYFATYQALAGDWGGAPLYRAFAPDFFDLIVVDECHRGSAHDESDWREILTHFAPAAQLGMTATPLRQDNRDTYRYFRDPLYVYSLRQGIEDGFLAPYRVHRVVTNWDAAGWRPSVGDLDRYGREIPDDEYGTPDFERKVALRERTAAIAAHLTDYLQQTDPMAKTIVFCVDQPHALEMARQLANGAPDQMRAYPDYVARVTSDEGDIGKGHLASFQDIERRTPVILTTSQLLTTGVDAPTCKNVVLARMVGSIVEFKQIIGRGTRLREDYGKLSFNIIDYTGSATRHFADAEFDGDPVIEDVIEIDETGAVIGEQTVIDNTGLDEDGTDGKGVREGGVGLGSLADVDVDELPRKFYFDGGSVAIVAHQVQELDPDGHLLRTVAFTDYTGEKVRTLFPSPTDLRAVWVDAKRRDEMLAMLDERGLTPQLIAEKTGHPEADTFDLLCHLAFNLPVLTRRERATRLAKERAAFFERFGPEARQILNELIEKYAEHGIWQLRLPDALKVPPLTSHGNPSEIAAAFGGAAKLRDAISDLQALLYAA